MLSYLPSYASWYNDLIRMAGGLIKNNNNLNTQSGFDVKTPLWFGLKAFFRNNKNTFPFLYYIVMISGVWIFATQISWGIYIFLVVLIVPAVAAQIRSYIQPNSFASEEHIEILTDLSQQGNKDVGTQDVVDGQTLYFPTKISKQEIQGTARIVKPELVKTSGKGKK